MRIIGSVLSILAFGGGVSLAPAVYAQEKPTLVLVHGALFTAKSWSKVQDLLQKDGYPSVAVNVPGRPGGRWNPAEVDLNVATHSVCEVVNQIAGPVILVGHSQGGGLITQATAECPQKIQKLIYVAALIPRPGEIVFHDLTSADGVYIHRAIKPDQTAQTLHIESRSLLAEAFVQDANSADQKELTDTMVDEPIKIGQSIAYYPLNPFLRTPKVYIETTLDRVVTPGTQHQIESKFPFEKTISLNTSHSPMWSAPVKLVMALEEAIAPALSRKHALR